ncbi:LOW QUALITY PROTEIN: hypothetical protein U9M48_003432 [Paspalum notatum var. saurae]|uniref:Uncharacterized protein n=1 Tax=Paspalum notatum var. saurae TaxID=547442 RepID=A0AAQ3PR34_PASNO
MRVTWAHDGPKPRAYVASAKPPPSAHDYDRPREPPHATTIAPRLESLTHARSRPPLAIAPSPVEPSAPIPRSSVAIAQARVIHALGVCLASELYRRKENRPRHRGCQVDDQHDCIGTAISLSQGEPCKYWARIRSRVDTETSCRLLHRDRHLSQRRYDKQW